jgi:hypothetical protein
LVAPISENGAANPGAADQLHLSAEEVAEILKIVQGTDAILIGGQCLNFWAEHYAPRDPQLAARGPFTSKDIDFYKNRTAAEKLTEVFGGILYLPEHPKLDERWRLNNLAKSIARLEKMLSRKTL